MNTSILTVVLASSLLAGQNGTPNWQSSYSHAQQIGTEQKKPIAVVFGSGANGWNKVVRDSAPAAEVTQLLAAQYVCVYVDTASSAGKKLAEGFGITRDSGVVLSDRGGSVQAFWHQGDLTNQALTFYLQKYSSPNAVVRGTETLNPARTSFYPAAEDTWNSVGTSSSYCPSCNNARGRR